MTANENEESLGGRPLRSGLAEIYRLLSPGLRRQFRLLFVLSVAGAFAELATIGAVFPFLSLLAGAEQAGDRDWSTGLLKWLGAQGPQDQLVVATILFAGFAIVSGIVRVLLVRVTHDFMAGLSHELNVEIQRRILAQPYSFHVAQNSSRMLASLDKVHALVTSVLLPAIQAASAILIGLCIVAALMLLDPAATLAALSAFMLLYLLVSLRTRAALIRNSKILDRAWGERVKTVQESLGGIRDIILDGSQELYLDAFEEVDQRFSRAHATTAIMATAPRYAVEATGIVFIAVAALAIVGRDGNLAAALPILGALALGAQRLLPLVQQVYAAWTMASGYRSLLTEVLELLHLPVGEQAGIGRSQPLPFRERIQAKKVGLTYPARAQPALDDVSLDIPRGSSVALIGPTGSGKSTLADLLMGLLQPTEGSILVDGRPLTAPDRFRWQQNIAHVPQSIFLAHASIAANIALGISPAKVDRERLASAAETAQLARFISTLPDGYETLVGERGIRLSGGQRQRLGLARALYKNAPVLVLDEATNALDEQTEEAVMNALDMLRSNDRTVLIVAHRLSTIAKCDLVIRLEDGRVVETGSFADVVVKRQPR